MRIPRRDSVSVVFACLLPLALSASVATAGDESGHEIEIEIGTGYDDNPFLTPQNPYFDQFDEAVVNPTPRSGFYIPARISGRYLSGGEKSRFAPRYRLRGDIYPESTATNADETYARFSAGWERVLGRQGRRQNLYFLDPFVTYNEEVFFDRDTGLGEVAGADDVSNRYTYFAYGAETGVRFETGRRAQYRLEALYEQRDYEDVSGLPSLDHGRWRLRGRVELELAERARLYLHYAYQVRDYDERLSRDLDGAFSGANPSLSYAYRLARVTLRVRPNLAWSLYLDLDQDRRTDEFVGYNDYDETGYRIRSVVRAGERRLRIALGYRDRSHDNSFIFDKPLNPLDDSANPKKSYEIWDVDLHGEWPWRGNLKPFVDVEFRDQETADPRYTYSRLRAMVGLQWEF